MSNSSTKVISTKTVLQAKLFEVDEYKLKLPSGREVTHHVAKRGPTVVVFPITKDNDVYLVHQYRYMLKKVALEAVAGFIDEGEIPLEAAKRELKEETGIKAGKWKELGILEMAASVFDAKVHVYLAEDLQLGQAEPEEDEDITLVKMPVKEAIEKVFSGEINTSATVAGILMIGSRA